MRSIEVTVTVDPAEGALTQAALSSGETSDPTPLRVRSILIWLTIVLAIAAGVRITFALMVVSRHSPSTFADLHGDTVGYLRLGEYMYDGRPYGDGRALFRNRALIRPPGYPAFYTGVRAAYRLVGVDMAGDLRPIVWPQIAVSLAHVAATFAIALIALRRLAPAVAAGLIAALTPTGIAATAIAMPDSPFAACFAVAFVGLIVTTFGWRRPAFVSIAGGALACAALLKPAAIYWPAICIPAVLLTRGLTWAALADLRRLLLPLIIVVLTWTCFNDLTQGVRAYSIVADRNMRYDVVPKVEFVDRRHRMPTFAEYSRYAAKSVSRDDKYIRQLDASPSDLYDLITRETRAVVRQHPWTTVKVMASNLRTQITARYKLLHRQLPQHDDTAMTMRRMIEVTEGQLLVGLWYGPMLLGLPLWLHDRRARRVLVLCWIGFAYIALPLGSVKYEGSRLLLAGEPMAATLIVAGVFGIVEVLRRWFRRRAERRSRGERLTTPAASSDSLPPRASVS